MTIFLLLNGIGVVFLLYALANFWKEVHSPKNNARNCATKYGRRQRADKIVVIYPISHSAQGGLSVIPFRGRDRYSDKPAGRMPPLGTPQERVKRISTR